MDSQAAGAAGAAGGAAERARPAPPSFRLRVVDADYTLERPEMGLDAARSPLTHKPLATAPVLRIFGSTPAGQKACLHVHQVPARAAAGGACGRGSVAPPQVFPYFYVPMEPLEREPRRSLAQLAEALERAMQTALQRVSAPRGEMHARSDGTRCSRALATPPLCSTSSRHGPQRTATHARTCAAHRSTQVERIPFYGFCPVRRPFACVYLVSPYHVTRATELLQSGAVGDGRAAAAGAAQSHADSRAPSARSWNGCFSRTTRTCRTYSTSSPIMGLQGWASRRWRPARRARARARALSSTSRWIRSRAAHSGSVSRCAIVCRESERIST
jgi:hypothetical protein